jgi:hypothetical protein
LPGSEQDAEFVLEFKFFGASTFRKSFKSCGFTPFFWLFNISEDTISKMVKVPLILSFFTQNALHGLAKLPLENLAAVLEQ